MYPLLEELTFRGFIQTIILDRTTTLRRLFGISLANFITSILFSLMHCANYGINKAALVFVPSLILGYSRELSGGMKFPIILHMLFNLIYWVGFKYF